MIVYYLIIIFFVSFFLALRSMKDFQLPKEIKRILDQKKIKGRIIFFKDKIRRF